MSIKSQIERLERRVGDEEERTIIFIGVGGHKLPKECEEALIAQEASGTYSIIFGFERAEDGRFLCRHCGKEHLIPERGTEHGIGGR